MKAKFIQQEIHNLIHEYIKEKHGAASVPIVETTVTYNGVAERITVLAGVTESPETPEVTRGGEPNLAPK